MTSRLPPYVAVVRPGERELFRILQNYLETRGLVEVVWDRRAGERRTLAERRRGRRTVEGSRRRGERREPRPSAATPLGFFIARRRGAPAGRHGDKADRRD